MDGARIVDFPYYASDTYIRFRRQGLGSEEALYLTYMEAQLRCKMPCEPPALPAKIDYVPAKSLRLSTELDATE